MLEGLTDSERARSDDRLLRLRPETPGVFSGLVEEGLYGGVRAGMAKLEQFDIAVNELLKTPAQSLDDIFGTKTEQYLTEENERIRKDVNQFQPDPQTAGFGAQLVHSLVDVGGRAIVGTVATGTPYGGAAVVGGTEALAQFEAGVEQGLDPDTAAGKALIHGVTLGAGAAAPAAFGASVLKNVLAYGPAANVTLGLIERGGVSSYLKAKGYDDLAKQYELLDGTAMVTDAVLGALFGYIGTRGRVPLTREPTHADLDAALAVNRSQHIEVGTAPGIPSDVRSRNAHVEAVTKATEDMLLGREVDVSQQLEGADFVPRPTPPDLAERMAGKKIAEMTREEMRNELLVDKLTGVGSLRAFEESTLPVRASIDADSLKWVNDNLGHDAGDRLLKAIGKTLGEEVRHAFRIGGDEFAIAAKTIKEAQEAMERVSEKLKNHVITAQLPDGTVIQKKGVSLSYGIGKTTSEAEAGLRAHKEQREREGVRPARGREPPGVSRIPAGWKQIAQRRGADEGATGRPDKPAVTEKAAVPVKEKPDSAVSPKADAPRRETESGVKSPTQELASRYASELDVAKQSLADKPSMKIPDDNGTMVSAADAMREADEAIAKAENDAPGFRAAINCFLTHGG